MFRLIKVSGDSMSPTLEHGDIIITTKPRTIRAGFIYVIDHIDLGTIIKRVERIDARGRVRLIGDNTASTPPSVMGWTAPDRIRARASVSLSKRGVKRL